MGDNGFKETFKVLNESHEYFKTWGEQFASLSKPIKEWGERLASQWKPYPEWEGKHDFLVTNGWPYFIELPRSLMDEIYARKGSIQTIEVDKIVIDFFARIIVRSLKKL